MTRLILRLFLAVVVLGLIAAWFAYFLGGANGFSTRENPTAIESFLARTARHLAVPHSAKEAANPVAVTPEILQEGRRHFADHCANCHANDGSGNTEMGRLLYPRAPDMRESGTQSMSDGEIYFVIHNGIRLSGMPAWGSESGHGNAAGHSHGADENPGSVKDRDSWILVDFIRHLPKLTADELGDMKQYNPRSPVEIQEEKEEEDYLNGK